MALHWLGVYVSSFCSLQGFFFLGGGGGVSYPAVSQVIA